MGITRLTLDGQGLLCTVVKARIRLKSSLRKIKYFISDFCCSFLNATWSTIRIIFCKWNVSYLYGIRGVRKRCDIGPLHIQQSCQHTLPWILLYVVFKKEQQKSEIKYFIFFNDDFNLICALTIVHNRPWHPKLIW